MKVMERINIDKKSRAGITVWLKRGVWLLLSFALSLSSVVGGSCPFAVSLISVSSKKNLLFASIGAGFGYALFCDHNDAVRYFSATLICSLATLVINIFNARNDCYPSMLASGLSVLATGLVMAFRTSALPSEYALVLGESILAVGGSFFFFRAVNSSMKRLKFKALPIADLTCVIISAAIVLSGLSYFEIYGISVARILSVLVILTSVRFGSQRWGMILSLCLGFALGISRENSLFLLGAYAFSALVASLFVTFSSLGIGFSFTLSMAFFAVAANLGSFSVCCVVESAAAGVIIALLPEVATSWLTELWESGADIAPDGSLRQSLVVRLRFASSALAQVSESVRDVREKINRLGRGEPMESELRMVAADQFFSISDMLEDLAFEFDDAESFDYKSAGRIRRLLGEFEIYPENISVIEDKYGRFRIEILSPKGTKGLDNPKLRYEMSKICKREFEKSRITITNAGMLLSFIEKPNYKMSIGFAQHSAEGRLCGDTIKTINDSKGHMVLIISDGMGKGSRAALDGAMGAGLLSKLLCAGFGFDSSLKVVNSALLVKSNEESLATLDCASIDLFTGRCEIYKAGAPRSYVLKEDKLTKCELSSMPAGILRGIEFAKRTTMLNLDDEIYMMSDGITDLGEEWLESIIMELDDLSPNEKAQVILDEAIAMCDERHMDDMSIIVAKLLEHN